MISRNCTEYVYNDVRKIFLGFKEKVKETDVDEVKRTRKVSNERINHLLLEAVAKAVDEHTRSKPPLDMTEIARVIQAALLVQILVHILTILDYQDFVYSRIIFCVFYLIVFVQF